MVLQVPQVAHLARATSSRTIQKHRFEPGSLRPFHVSDGIITHMQDFTRVQPQNFRRS